MPQYQTGTPGNDHLVGTWWVDIVYGADGHDTVYGDRGDDILYGDNGNDILVGGIGADQIFGGAGFDISSYVTSAAAIFIDFNTRQFAGDEAQGDQLFSIEGIVGTAFNDTITMDYLDNFIRGGAGADRIDGGLGQDTASYAYSAAAVDVDLTRLNIAQIGGDAAGDILLGVENLIGSDLADRLLGSSLNNVLTGGAGADYLNGRGGLDTVDYRGSAAAISIDLALVVQHGGDAEGDQLYNIENARASAQDDMLSGNDFNNRLLGDGGGDALHGHAGNDHLDGGAGNDTMTGGSGADTFTFGPGQDVVTDFDAAGGDRILVALSLQDETTDTFVALLAHAIDTPAGLELHHAASGATLLLQGISKADFTADNVIYAHTETVGSSGDDYLAAPIYASDLYGMDGNDVLLGDLGSDRLYGGDGDDIIRGGFAPDLIDGGAGFDIASYATATDAVRIELWREDGRQPEYNQFHDSNNHARNDVLVSIEGVIGSKFNDYLAGDGGDNYFRGGGGADEIRGGNGRDRASYEDADTFVDVDLTRTGPQNGGASGDILVSIENLTGSAHNDWLKGDSNTNEINGGAGADKIDGGAGRDFVDYRGSGAVTIDLNQVIQRRGHAEGDQLYNIEDVRGSIGNDSLFGNTFGNHLIGDNGNDLIYGGAGNDTLNGGAGDDYLAGDEGDDHLYGGDGDDVLKGGNGPGIDVLIGGNGNDTLAGSYGDTLEGGAGNDTADLTYDLSDPQTITIDLSAGIATGIATLSGFENLYVLGGAGNHHIVGGHGVNLITTHGGDDYVQVFGYNNHVRLSNGSGNDFDTYIGSDGKDTVFMGRNGIADGGGGTEDTLDIRLFMNGNLNFDVNDGATGTGLTFTNFEHYVIEREVAIGNDTIRLGQGNDIARAAGGRDFVEGRGGNDQLFGGNGDDALSGGDGDDLLHGEAGNDALTGGTGTDQFQFSRGNDIVTDFSTDEGDRIFVPKAYQPQDGYDFASFVAAAEETDDGLLLHSVFSDSTLLLAGITKASFNENSVEFGT